MDNITFEDLKEEDLDEIVEIYNYYILNTTVIFFKKPFSKEEMKRLLYFDNAKYKTFVIKSLNKLCGYVVLGQYKKREAYDETAEISIYLKDDYMGKGIGDFAIKFIENYAKEQKMHTLIASICAENAKSIKLFEKNGFVKCAHYREIGKKFGKLLDVVDYQKIIS